MAAVVVLPEWVDQEVETEEETAVEAQVAEKAEGCTAGSVEPGPADTEAATVAAVAPMATAAGTGTWLAAGCSRYTSWGSAPADRRPRTRNSSGRSARTSSTSTAYRPRPPPSYRRRSMCQAAMSDHTPTSPRASPSRNPNTAPRTRRPRLPALRPRLRTPHSQSSHADSHTPPGPSSTAACTDTAPRIVREAGPAPQRAQAVTVASAVSQ